MKAYKLTVENYLTIDRMDKEHREIFLKEAENSGIAVLYTRVGKPEYEHETEIKK
jgi:hypothetical protein